MAGIERHFCSCEKGIQAAGPEMANIVGTAVRKMLKTINEHVQTVLTSCIGNRTQTLNITLEGLCKEWKLQKVKRAGVVTNYPRGQH